jgi:hypothetical protein
MVANEKTIRQEAETRRSIRDIVTRLSLRNKIIGIAVIAFLLLLVISIPGDRSQLIARQERVESAQVAYDLAFPAVGPMIDRVKAFLDNAQPELSQNRLYTGLSSAMNTFNRASASVASRFQGLVTFSANIHGLLDGPNAVPELNTDEFELLVADMDATMGVALLALMEVNGAIDEYNGYYSWISAKVTGALFGLPQGYPDPVPANSRLSGESLTR